MPTISKGEPQSVGFYPTAKELRVSRAPSGWRGTAAFTVYQSDNPAIVLGAGSPPAPTAMQNYIPVRIPPNTDCTILNAGEVDLIWKIFDLV